MRSSYGNTLKTLATRLIRLFFQLTLTAVIVLVLLSIFAFLRIQAGPISHPRIVDFIEDRINQRLQGGRLEIGSIALETDSNFVQSKITLSDIILHGSTQTLARLPMAAIDLANGDVLQGQFRPLALRLTGLSLQVVRDKNGVFNFQMDSGADANRMEFASIDAALVAFNNIAGLARLDEISLRGAKIDYRDLRTAQQLSFEQVDLRLSRAADLFNARLSLSLQGNEETPSQISMDITHRLGEAFSAAEVSFDNIHLAALSEQIGELNIPQALPMRDAPLSGRFSFDLNEAGIDNFIGAIETGAQLTPTEQTENSRVYFTYSGRDNAFNISRLDLRLPFGLLRGGGQVALVYGLLDAKDTLQTISADLKIDQISVDESVGIESALLLKDGVIRGAFDLQSNRFDLFEGRIVTDQTDVTLSGAHWKDSGKDAGKDAGQAGDWQGAYRFSSNAIGIGDFLQLWPVGVKPQVRRWMQRQIRRGTITSMLGELEIVGNVPQFQIDFMFRDLDIEYVAGLPILRAARGTGVLTHRALDMSLASGFVAGKDGGRIELAGSQFAIPDLTIPRRAPGVFRLRAAGSVLSTLNLLDVEKFRFLSKIGLGTDIGQGRVQATGTLTLPLADKITTADIALDFDGHVRDFYSDKMFVDHEITARDIAFTATHKGITMQGAAALDGIAARGVWQMDFDGGARGGDTVDETQGAKSYLDVDFALNAESMGRFGVTLPDGYVDGTADAKMKLTFEKGQGIAYALSSELVGMTLTIEALGWTKPPEQAGSLRLSGFLTAPFSVDNIAFTSADLQTTGRVILGEDGSFERLSLDKFTLADTLDTSLELIAPSGQSPPRIVTRGGTVDLRKLNFARMAEPSDEVLELAFDTFQITDSIALTNFTARLANEGASHGTFGGQVNGAAGITGTLGKSQHGVRIDVQTQDAGGLLESAGLLNGAVQGTGSFSLIPQEQTGFYSGNFEINDGRLNTTNPLIDLVNSVSILGLVQQLEGQGVHFEQSEGRFTLQPNGVVLHELSAIGASVGVSMSGVYDADAGMVDFDGEFTPLYALNGLFEGIFGQLSARNKGGGLFGFTYTVKGGFDEPKVEVNPVSILAPGLLRRIFQPQNAPSLDAPEGEFKLSPELVIPEQNR